MRNMLLVGMGGFVGSALRYAASGAVQRLWPAAAFPLGTLTVNVVGCLVIGLLGGYAENVQAFTPGVRLFVMLGLLGGFTTYSSFGYETMALLRDGQALWAFGNVALHMIVGLGAVWLGYGLSTLS